MGDTIQAKGWNKENAINPNFYITPYINTEAPIREHFRVLDETELNRLAQDYEGDKEDLKAQASRTFVFDMPSVAYIYEYSYEKQNLNNPDKVMCFNIKGSSRFRHQINMTQLNPNKFYCMTFIGWAKEIENGQEVNPLKWNEKKKKYENVPWRQEKIISSAPVREKPWTTVRKICNSMWLLHIHHIATKLSRTKLSKHIVRILSVQTLHSYPTFHKRLSKMAN